MAHFIAAYDTENEKCLAAVRTIVKRHEAREVPATFFLVAGLLDGQGDEYGAMLKDHPLFEIACHTYSHMPIVDTPRFGQAGPAERFLRELVESKQRIEDFFGCAVAGFRPPVSAPQGLRGARLALDVLASAGYSYVSSVAWGKDFSMPAPLTPPFTYDEEGHPELWEIPPCGWHENLLKGHNMREPMLLCLFPPPIPEAVPDHFVATPEEEFAFNNKVFIDAAMAAQAHLVSLVWHPWSLGRLDPEMRMLELTFDYLKARGLPTATFAQMRDRLESTRGTPLDEA